jgi:hypothetical protein
MDDFVIAFLDLKERNDNERQRLADRRFALQIQQQNDGGQLPPALQNELTNINARLADGVLVVDPLYGGDKIAHPEAFDADPATGRPADPAGVREILGLINAGNRVGDHQDGLMPSQYQVNTPAPTPPGGPATDPVPGPERLRTATRAATTNRAALGDPALTPQEMALAATYGLLETDNQNDPNLAKFYQAVSGALGEYTNNIDLFGEVFKVLLQEGQDKLGVQSGYPGEGPQTIGVRADQWAAVVRILRAQGVTAQDPYLPLKARAALAQAIGTGNDTPPASISIDLPDLEAQSDVLIQADNIRAMQAIFFAATLEDLKLFQVVDKLVELFQSGMLPLGRGNAGNFLYSYWKKSVNRFTEVERRNLYARTFGFPGGEASQETVNREFDDLWLRFVSAVASFVRQFQVDDLLRARIPFSLSQEQVRKSGRDLAANLSLHGYGIAYFAATDLQNQIQEIITLLSDPDIKTAYGARDMWQVVDQVATLELGGAKNSIRYRTMATSGAVIIRWLAERANLLSSGNQIQVIDVRQLRNPPLRPKGAKPTVAPTDKDLVDACDQWLAVTGTQDKSVEEYAQPTVGPNLTSRPIQIPRVAQDLLASVGVKANGSILG